MTRPTAESVSRDEVVASLVVDAALLTAVDAADGHAICLVEELHRLVVLQLSVFDDEVELLVVGIDRELPRSAVTRWVTDVSFEAMLA